MRDIQNLLTQVETLTRKNNEILQATGGKFNVFSLLKVDHYENTHSSIIAELLRPHGTHGLNDAFLKLFIEEITESVPFKEFAVENASVITEADTGNGRIDILLDDFKGHAIIIENKLYAPDQPEQLFRYNTFAASKYEETNYHLFYLTLDGKEATIDSAKGVTYQRISYKDHLVNWLGKCIEKSAQFPLVRETLIQYRIHLKKLTKQDINSKNSMEIANLITTQQGNFEAALKISENLELAKRIILNDMIRKLSEEYNLEGRLKDLKDIMFRKSYWQSKSGIWFAFDNGKTYYSIKTEKAGLGEAPLQEQITELFHKKPDRWNPFGFDHVYHEHWESNNQLYLKIMNESFIKEIIKPHLDKVLNYLKENPRIDEML